MRKYVAFLPVGISSGCLKKIVFMDVALSFLRPWQRRANSFEQPSYHLSLESVLSKSRYSRSLPVTESSTALILWVLRSGRLSVRRSSCAMRVWTCSGRRGADSLAVALVT